MGAPLRRSLILLLALSCAGKTKTREEIAEDRSLGAEKLMIAASEAMDRLDAEVAQAKLEEARELLETPAAKRYPDHSFQLQELETKEARLIEVKAEVERRRIEEAFKQQSAKLNVLVAKMEVAVEPLSGRDAAVISKDQLEEAKEARQAVIEQLNEAVQLEKESPEYAKFAQEVAAKVKKSADPLKRAVRVMAFREGPVAKSQKARELVEKANAAEEPSDGVTILIEAQTELDRCAREATSMARETPALAKVAFDDGGTARRPKSLAKSCKQRSKRMRGAISKMKRKAKRKAAAEKRKQRQAEKKKKRKKKKKKK